MARKPENYWEKRNTELMKSIEKSTEDTITSLIIVYNKAAEEINKEIKKIFNRYADNGNLTEDEAIKLLSKIEKDEVYDELLTKINTLDNKKAVASILNKYNAAAYSYRISRYEAMLDRIELELRKLGELENKITRIRYVDTINEAYYHTIFNVQKELGYSFSFTEIDKKTLNLMLNNNWNNNANYSSRIWGNVQTLNDYLKTNLAVGNITGKSVHKIASELNSAMNMGLYNATRLVRTETNYFANQSELMAYEECGIEEYQFIATLDKITCKHCAELDKKVFKVKEAKPGKNCPPVHPMDRCATVAYFSDELEEELLRRAKDENGESIQIMQDMNYNEWQAKYINMTQSEKDAISKYSGPTSYSLNEKLRNNINLDDYEKELINNIDTGLEKIPNYTKTTYRQIGFDFQGEEEYNKFINYHKNNKIINYLQYISTSKNYNDYEVIDNLKVEITIDGKTGKDIRGLAGLKDENEVLFRRDTRFKVVKVDGNKIWLKEV